MTVGKLPNTKARRISTATDKKMKTVKHPEGSGMNIGKTTSETSLIVALEGRMDTSAAPSLEMELKQSIAGIKELLLDLTALAYSSSAGLRVLLSAQPLMNKQGRIIVRGANETGSI